MKQPRDTATDGTKDDRKQISRFLTPISSWPHHNIALGHARG